MILKDDTIIKQQKLKEHTNIKARYER